MRQVNGTSSDSEHLLIETNSPWESNDSRDFLQLAKALLDTGARVHLYLIQNGVLWLQQEAQTLIAMQAQYKHLLQLSVDDMSLDLRGMSRYNAGRTCAVRGIEFMVSAMAAPNVKTIWHS